jgi:hypothetical protein
MSEVIFVAVFVGFLVGFVAVLCIGNYFRARRAMERQRQRRLARLAGQNGAISSPRSSATSGASVQSDEHLHLLAGNKQRLPELPRRRPVEDIVSSRTGDLLYLHETTPSESSRPTVDLMSV